MIKYGALSKFLVIRPMTYSWRKYRNFELVKCSDVVKIMDCHAFRWISLNFHGVAPRQRGLGSSPGGNVEVLVQQTAQTSGAEKKPGWRSHGSQALDVRIRCMVWKVRRVAFHTLRDSSPTRKDASSTSVAGAEVPAAEPLRTRRRRSFPTGSTGSSRWGRASAS